MKRRRRRSTSQLVAARTLVDIKQKTAYEMLWRDWRSDVCSSDLSDVADQVLDGEVAE